MDMHIVETRILTPPLYYATLMNVLLLKGDLSTLAQKSLLAVL